MANSIKIAKMYFICPLFTAILAVAMAFTISCSDDKDDDGGLSSVGGISSSGGGSRSSSSSGGRSSSSVGNPVQLPPCVQGEVTIGTQVWQKCNLNDVPIGENGAATNSACYDNKDSNCAIYGRLYDWATAMNLQPHCIYTPCSLQMPHRGICPSGWHIPSNAEWDKLVRYVDGSNGTSSPYYSRTAGKYLKATSGWNDNGNGQDTYGFSALPSGMGTSDGSFSGIGNSGFGWSASEDNSNLAYGRYIYYYEEIVGYFNFSKVSLYPVRCLQD